MTSANVREETKQSLADRLLWRVSDRTAEEREAEILRERQTVAERYRESRFRSLLAESNLFYRSAEFKTNDYGESFIVRGKFTYRFPDGTTKEFGGNERAYQIAVKFAETFAASRPHDEMFKPESKGFAIIGSESGTGKTYLACAAAIAAMKRGYTLYFERFPSMLTKIRESYGRNFNYDDPSILTTAQVLKRYVDPDVLVIDDFGTENMGEGKNGDWARSELLAIVERRIEANKTTCFTTNLTPAELLKRYDRRIMSRLGDKKRMMAAVVDMPDYRLTEIEQAG